MAFLKSVKLALVSGLLATSVAIAADIPSGKTAPLPPVRPASLEPLFYVGAFGGGNLTEAKSWTGARVGAVVGVQPHRYVRLEGLYEYGWNSENANRSNSLFANAIAQYPVGRVTPYVLAGAGYRWADMKNEAVWNVGGGLRYALTTNVEADLRYRYVADYDVKNHQNVVTFGLNYRF